MEQTGGRTTFLAKALAKADADREARTARSMASSSIGTGGLAPSSIGTGGSSIGAGTMMLPTTQQQQQIDAEADEQFTARAYGTQAARGKRTLAELSSLDPKWNRLLQDPDGLFGNEDIVDETYEQYLSDVLLVMEKNECSFKHAVQDSCFFSCLSTSPSPQAQMPQAVQEPQVDTARASNERRSVGMQSPKADVSISARGKMSPWSPRKFACDRDVPLSVTTPTTVISTDAAVHMPPFATCATQGLLQSAQGVQEQQNEGFGERISACEAMVNSLRSRLDSTCAFMEVDHASKMRQLEDRFGQAELALSKRFEELESHINRGAREELRHGQEDQTLSKRFEELQLHVKTISELTSNFMSRLNALELESRQKLQLAELVPRMSLAPGSTFSSAATVARQMMDLDKGVGYALGRTSSGFCRNDSDGMSEQTSPMPLSEQAFVAKPDETDLSDDIDLMQSFPTLGRSGKGTIIVGEGATKATVKTRQEVKDIANGRCLPPMCSKSESEASAYGASNLQCCDLDATIPNGMSLVT